MGIGIQQTNTKAKLHAKATGWLPEELTQRPTITAILNEEKTQITVSDATGLDKGVLLKVDGVSEQRMIIQVEGSTFTVDQAFDQAFTDSLENAPVPFQYQQPIARLDSQVNGQAQPQFFVLANGNVIIGTENNPVPAEDISLLVGGKVFAQDVTSGNIEQLSSIAFKEEITNLSSKETAKILSSLNPVKFRYIYEDKSNNLHAGFIAEDMPDLLTSSDGQAIKILDIVAILTQAVKYDRKVVKELWNLVKKQQSSIDTLTRKVQALEKQNQGGV